MLAELARLDDAAFRALFAKSPVKRIGRDRFIRNVLIAIGNADDADLAVEAERLLDDESPLVRGAAVWALSQLMERDEFQPLPPANRPAKPTRACARNGERLPEHNPHPESGLWPRLEGWAACVAMVRDGASRLLTMIVMRHP